MAGDARRRASGRADRGDGIDGSTGKRAGDGCAFGGHRADVYPAGNGAPSSRKRARGGGLEPLPKLSLGSPADGRNGSADGQISASGLSALRTRRQRRRHAHVRDREAGQRGLDEAPNGRAAQCRRVAHCARVRASSPVSERAKLYLPGFRQAHRHVSMGPATSHGIT